MSDRLVFVVGAPRSGTTWVQRALSAHPDVLAFPSETHLFSWGLAALQEQAQGGVLESPSTASFFMPRSEFTKAARDFADAALGGYVARTRPSAARVVERSPTHVWHLALINAVYPDSWVLHVVRDGRDVVRSQVAQEWGPQTIGQAASQWASAIRAARAVAPDLRRYHEVRYEELLHQPSRVTELFAFLELPPMDEALRQAELESGRAVNVDPSNPRIAAGKWRSEWSAADMTAFEQAAGDALREAGYEPLEVLDEPSPAPARRRGRRRAPAVAPGLDMEQAQRVVDRLAEELGLGELATLRAHATPTTVVRHRSADQAWTLLGEEGISRLEQQLVPWGEAEQGDQQIAGRTWTLVLAHRAEGVSRDRLLQVTFDQAGQIAELRLTVFGPSAGAA